ncbi:MAG: hypothetical protein ACRD3N_00180 [Terracidiphilus sp.]
MASPISEFSAGAEGLVHHLGFCAGDKTCEPGGCQPELGRLPSSRRVGPQTAAHGGRFAPLTILLVVALACGSAAAQGSAAPRKALAQHRPVAARHHAHRAQAAAVPAKPALAKPAAAAAEPAASAAPKWPVNDPPSQPSVTWNGRELRIDAMNASLKQIMKEVSADTGAKVQGFDADQRVFGLYGPGEPREVLSQLLDGTGYNVIIVGDRAAGEPLRIVLSAAPTGPAPNVPSYQRSSDEQDYQPEEPLPYPPQPGIVPGQPPRTPQQIMEEMQQRQQQTREQQQMEMERQQEMQRQEQMRQNNPQ